MTLDFSFIKRCSFLYRTLAIFLSIILCFHIICKPVEVEASAVLTITEIGIIVGIVTGIITTGVSVANYFKKEKPDTDPVEYFNKEITVDGDGNYVLSDDAMLVVNQMKSDMEEQATYTNAYPFRVDGLDANNCATKKQYDAICDVIQTFGVDNYIMFYRDTRFREGFQCYILYDLAGGVSNNIKTGFLDFTLYNSDWVRCQYSLILVHDNGSVMYNGRREDGLAVDKSIDSVEAILEVDDLVVYNDAPWTAHAYTMLGQSTPLYAAGIWADIKHMGTFPVYGSLNALKNGTAHGMGVQFLPDYKPGNVTNNTISEGDITNYNNIVNNYYGDDSGGSGGGGSGGGSGGSSGGGIFDMIFGALGSLVSGIVDGIGGLLVKLFDSLASAIKKLVNSITSTFDDLKKMLDTDFMGFITAIFPFLPKEWVTLISLGLGLILVVSVIKIFRG